MLIRKKNYNTGKPKMNRRLLFTSIVMATVILCVTLCSCNNKPENESEKGNGQGVNGGTISAQSLWYDSERMDLKLFPDDRETIINHSVYDYFNGELHVVCDYYALPTEAEILSGEYDESSCYGTDLCVFDNNGALKKRVDLKKRSVLEKERFFKISGSFFYCSFA